MKISKLKEILNNYSHYSYPEIEFNNSLFRFSISHDGFLILGPEMEAKEIWDAIETLDDSDELITAVAMRLSIDES